MAENPTRNATVALVGDVGVGKRTLFLRFQEGRFVEEGRRILMGMDTIKEHTKQLDSGVKLTLSVGMDDVLYYSHKTYHPNVFERFNAIIYVFAMDDKDTLASLRLPMEHTEVFVPQLIIRAVVGNKIDLESDTVKKEEVKQWAINNDISEDMIFYVSAKTGEGVDDMFKKVAEKMAPPPKRSTQPSNSNSGCCLKK
jgi:GTPase SAR1 family protein